MSALSKARPISNLPLFMLLLIALLTAACSAENAPAPTHTAEPTPAATAEPTPAPTLDSAEAEKLALALFPEVEGMAITSSAALSPDGRWQVVSTSSPPVMNDDGSEQFFNGLALTDGETTYRPAAEWRPYGLGLEQAQVYRWSSNGRYLYYNNVPSVDGCGLFFNGSDLYRLDLQSGDITELLGPNTSPYPLYHLSLSPDESELAYIYREEGHLKLAARPVSGGPERTTPLTEEGQSVQAGTIVWSPDQALLALTLAYQPCSDEWTHSIVVVETADLEQELILDQDPRLFSPTRWIDNATVEVVDGEQSRYNLDIATGSLTPKG